MILRNVLSALFITALALNASLLSGCKDDNKQAPADEAPADMHDAGDHGDDAHGDDMMDEAEDAE